MTAGEFTYDNIFLFEDNFEATLTGAPQHLNYFTMSCILWVIFIILMPVLFANLLVSAIYQYIYVCVQGSRKMKFIGGTQPRIDYI